MKALSFSNEQFNNLESFFLEEQIVHTEADFFIYEAADGTRLIKKYKHTDKKYLNNKVRTVYALDKVKKELDIKELILPDKVVFQGERFIGFAAPLVQGVNADIVLSSKKASTACKINVLKQIGKILQKIEKHEKEYGLAFGDVHAGNFIFNGQSTVAIDTDSMKINGNDAFASMYLTLNPNLSSCDKKYPCNVYGVYDPTSNSDILSFIMTILDVIGDGEVYRMKTDNYLRYIDYLDKLGFDSKLLECFTAIYDPKKDNINPTPYLDTISIIDETTSLASFRRIK